MWSGLQGIKRRTHANAATLQILQHEMLCWATCGVCPAAAHGNHLSMSTAGWNVGLRLLAAIVDSCGMYSASVLEDISLQRLALPDAALALRSEVSRL